MIEYKLHSGHRDGHGEQDNKPDNMLSGPWFKMTTCCGIQDCCAKADQGRQDEYHTPRQGGDRGRDDAVHVVGSSGGGAAG